MPPSNRNKFTEAIVKQHCRLKRKLIWKTPKILPRSSMEEKQYAATLKTKGFAIEGRMCLNKSDT